MPVNGVGSAAEEHAVKMPHSARSAVLRREDERASWGFRMGVGFGAVYAG